MHGGGEEALRAGDMRTTVERPDRRAEGGRTTESPKEWRGKKGKAVGVAKRRGIEARLSGERMDFWTASSGVGGGRSR